MGNCSLSLAPVKPADRRALAGMFKQIEDIPLATFAEGVPWSLGDLSRVPRLTSARVSASTSPGLVGHSALRTYVMGAAAQERAATDDEIAAMCRLLQDAIRGGAAGLSTSYVDIDENMRPVPSRFATRDEIIALGQAMADGRARHHPDRAGLLQPAAAARRTSTRWREISRADRPDVHARADRPLDARRRSGRTRSAALDGGDARAARASTGSRMPRTFDINIRLSETSFLLYALPAWAELMRMPLPERLRRRSPIRRAATSCATQVDACSARCCTCSPSARRRARREQGARGPHARRDRGRARRRRRPT